MRFLPLVLCLTFGALSVSCGPAKEKCSMSNCTGCCDAMGACQAGSLATACGSGGAACLACISNYQCNFGFCQPPVFAGGGGGSSGGGGGSGGGTGGGGTMGGGTGGGTTGGGTGGGTTGGGTGGGSGGCSPSNCAGCCTTGGVCQTGTTSTSCGQGGVTCSTCSGSLVCSQGLCVAPSSCSPSNCAGCCNSGGTCLSGTTTAACGSNGNVCAACISSQTCSAGSCITTCSPTNCAGCCSSSGVCLAGDTLAACGFGGNACAACAGTQTCSTGTCTGGGGMVRYGNSGTFTTASSHTAGYLLGYSFSVPTAFTLTSFGINISSVPAGGQGRFALYSNSGGAPGTLLASTPLVTLSAGRQEYTASASVPLTAGTYWLMSNFSVDTSVFHSSTSVTSDYRSLTTSMALPTTFGTPQTFTATEINTWVVGF